MTSSQKCTNRILRSPNIKTIEQINAGALSLDILTAEIVNRGLSIIDENNIEMFAHFCTVTPIYLPDGWSRSRQRRPKNPYLSFLFYSIQFDSMWVYKCTGKDKPKEKETESDEPTKKKEEVDCSHCWEFYWREFFNVHKSQS